MRHGKLIHERLFAAGLGLFVALQFVFVPACPAADANQAGGQNLPVIIDNDLPGELPIVGTGPSEAGDRLQGEESAAGSECTQVQAAETKTAERPEPEATGPDEHANEGRKIASVITDLDLVDDSDGVVELDGPIVIDNDQAKESIPTIAYEELETTDGGAKIKTGALFPVVVVSQLSSKTAKKGDPFEARLKYDLKIGSRLVACRGAKVVGHLDYAMKARSIMHSLLSYKRWYRNSGALGITFDEIITSGGEHLPLVAKPAQKDRIVKNKGEGRVLGVNHQGIITGPWGQQLRYKAIRIGLNAALAPAGVFSFGAMPVALGVMGAVNPSFAFSKPVGLNVRHRRIKGFMWGFLSGVPGSWIIEDTVIKGQECKIKPGDEFLCEFREEFTGEPATDARLIPGATTSVYGQVEKTKDKKKVKPGKTRRLRKKGVKLSRKAS